MSWKLEYEQNRDKEARRAYMKDYHKKWYAKNKEKKLAQNRTWQLLNPEKVLQLNREWQRCPARRAYSAKYLKEYRKAEPDRFRLYESRRANKGQGSSTYYRKNKSKVINAVNARRDKTVRVQTKETAEKVAQLLKEQSCYWCLRCLTDKNFTIDHVIPLVRGGRHIADNLVASCRSCNSSKGAKLLSEWKPRKDLAYVVA